MLSEVTEYRLLALGECIEAYEDIDFGLFE
ncbi:Uncharacterised protein [Chlamydia trachomatis]|nr:Uncharacterised protein [Chlamydia trachomatis]